LIFEELIFMEKRMRIKNKEEKKIKESLKLVETEPLKKELERLHTKSLNREYITFGEFKRFVKSIEKEQAQEFQKKIIEVIKGIAFYNEESEEMVLNKINKIFSEEGEGKE
jgi:hypothetical protein